MGDLNFRLRDLLYLDFAKTASIWSQFEGGLLERVSVSEDTGKDRTAGTKFGIPSLAEAQLSVDYLQKRSTLQSKTLHHEVLNLVESRLAKAGLVADLSELVPMNESSPEAVRAALINRPYLRAEGWSVVEDYQRIESICAKVNEIVEFVARAGQDTLRKSPQYQQLQDAIRARRDAVKQISDRNQRAIQQTELRSLEQKLDELTRPQLQTVEQWLIDGIRLWIKTFMPTRINFRIFPFSECPSFQILCNLKRECFVDSDLEHLLYGYGNRPNVPLAVFGLVTSMPSKDLSSFDPMQEFKDDSTASRPEMEVEKAFRNMFDGMEGIESFIRYSRYPNVTVHPIAVYRSFPIKSD